jgi:hypothetical protein
MKQRSRKRLLWYFSVLTLVGASAWVAFAIGGAISVLSVNTVSTATSQYRWEPSSADTGGWLTSYHDLPAPRGQVNFDQIHAYTTSWNGGSWSAPVEHRGNGNPMLDQFTYWDAFHSKYTHVALDVGNSVGWHSVYIASSTDGNSWSPTTLVPGFAGSAFTNTSWDFPSVAVDNNGRNSSGSFKAHTWKRRILDRI